MNARDARRDDLWDYAVAHPDGFTNEQAMSEFDWDLKTFNTAVQDLRLLLEDDQITLPCDPQGQHEKWLYRLVGHYDDGRAWAINRLLDSETRLRTIEAYSSALMHSTDGRTADGKKARLIHSTAAYLREQIELLDPEARA